MRYALYYDDHCANKIDGVHRIFALNLIDIILKGGKKTNALHLVHQRPDDYLVDNGHRYPPAKALIAQLSPGTAKIDQI